jgi:lipoprotein-anchoring transpeptidase ErfK/SrfK
MDTMLKWVGGASAAVVLALAGAAYAGGFMGAAAQSAPAPSFEQAIPAETASMVPAALVKPAPINPEGDRFVVKRILPIDGPIKYGQYFWDDSNVPDGPLVITVDLDARVLSVFRDGYEIGATAVLIGTDEHPTPLGTFPILSKERHNISERYNDTPMPYTLRLTADGVAVHSSPVRNGFASHGCIGTPDAFAAKLFSIAKTGDKVIVTRGATLAMGQSII